MANNPDKNVLMYVPDGHPDPMGYVNLVKSQILKPGKDGQPRPMEDLFYFLQVAKNAGLDPTLRQIYAVYRWDSRQEKEVMSIQTGIDGMRTIAERTGKYGGSDDAVYTEKDGIPVKASVTVYKLNPMTGERMPVTASARWSEYVPMKNNKPEFMWAKMPFLMLGKVAEALALRKAFPTTSQIYIKEEMDQADPVLSLPTPTTKKDENDGVKVSEKVEKMADAIEKNEGAE